VRRGFIYCLSCWRCGPSRAARAEPIFRSILGVSQLCRTQLYFFVAVTTPSHTRSECDRLAWLSWVLAYMLHSIASTWWPPTFLLLASAPGWFIL